MKMAIGSDHGGFELKEMLKKFLESNGVQVEDEGCFDKNSCDYPDFARAVAAKVSDGEVDEGVLICTTGIGMSIMANKFPRVRAALCVSPRMAKMAKAHNNANVLALGAEIITAEEAREIVKAWLETGFDGGERHRRRVAKIHSYACAITDPVSVYDEDPEIYAVLKNEEKRQRESIVLIASENYAGPAVREATGSVLTNKYAEGFPGNRWYDGCSFVDEAERLAIERALSLFGAEYANVQPHSGSAANMAVYFAALQPGDTILAMDLKHGGHLTHGMKTNFSGRLYNAVHYGVNPQTEQIDYDQVLELARQYKPRMIVAGASAYSRLIDFKLFRQAADSVGAFLLVDMAHIAGLVAANCHPSPVPYADFVTATTHKTLRGPRGGLILCRKQFGREIDRQIFPGIQGGPLMHVIAAKAVCFHEAAQPDFRAYQTQVVRNAQALAESLKNRGLRIVSGGTDNHLMLADLTPVNVTGKAAAGALNSVGIVVNKNAIPFDAQPPAVTSGIRVGVPAVTTRGMKEPEMRQIAEFITETLKNINNPKRLAEIRAGVSELSARFPVP